MEEVGTIEAKNSLDTLLDRVEHGEEIVITREGRPIARLVPPDIVVDAAAAEKALAAIDRIQARAKEAKLGPFDWEEWKKYRDEGRP